MRALSPTELFEVIMKPATKVLGLAAACAACCAVPFLVPLVAGAASVGGLAALLSTLCLEDGVLTFTWVEAGIVLAIVGVVATAVLRRRARGTRSPAAGGCGCGPISQTAGASE